MANDEVSLKNKEWIDNSSYSRLLSKWRFAPTGDPMFTGATGEYYSKVMAEKRKELAPGMAAQISKSIGF